MADLVVELEEIKTESRHADRRAASGSETRPVARRIGAGRAAAVGGRLVRVAETRLATAGRLIALTSYPGDESTPTFSPDGNQVAFTWNGPKRDNWDIYVTLLGAPTALRLTTDAAMERAPAWSPDGSQIAFVRGQGEPKRPSTSPVPYPDRYGRLADVRPVSGAEHTTVSWFPDRKRLVVAELAPTRRPAGYSNDPDRSWREAAARLDRCLGGQPFSQPSPPTERRWRTACALRCPAMSSSIGASAPTSCPKGSRNSSLIRAPTSRGSPGRPREIGHLRLFPGGESLWRMRSPGSARTRGTGFEGRRAIPRLLSRATSSLPAGSRTSTCGSSSQANRRRAPPLRPSRISTRSCQRTESGRVRHRPLRQGKRNLGRNLDGTGATRLTERRTGRRALRAGRPMAAGSPSTRRRRTDNGTSCGRLAGGPRRDSRRTHLTNPAELVTRGQMD